MRRWTSFNSHLEDVWDGEVDDDDDPNEITPGISSRRVGIDVTPDRPAYWNREACGLNAWIASHRRGKERKPMEISEWRNYLEKSATLLHSLVKTIVGGNRGIKGDSMACDEIHIHPKFITSKNVVVRKLKLTGEGKITADFVYRGDSILCASGEDGMRKKYRAMNALGRMAYEMFMLGEEPSASTLSSKSSAASFSDALSIHDREPSKGAMIDEDADIIDMLRKNPRTLTSEEQDCSGILSTMIAANVPFPVCRFVADLLDDPGGMLGRSELSFSSLTDVLSDLEQMVDSPDDFLHASSPDRWKLVFGDKLYGRGKEMKAFRDAADRVATIRSDPLLDILSGIKGRRTEAVMVYGSGGAGKSRLVSLAGTSLEKRGWRFLRCKFDRVVQPKPLSILASAFDKYFGLFASFPKNGDNNCSHPSALFSDSNRSCLASQEMRERLQRNIGLEGLGVLIKHIPSLRHLLNMPIPEDTTIEQSETMMQTLFGKLLQALSSRKTPILFFMDDLQWADPLSLRMLSALVKGERPDLLHLSPADNKQESQVDLEENIKVMFVGSYRDNEVGEDHQLAKVLRKFQADSSINVTNIVLTGLTLDTLNEMLSESLCVPVRRVRSLSKLVIQKTDGQPLHVIELIQKLTIDNLLTHSFARGWEWDADSIDIYPITDNVAELFTFKLQRLPRDTLLGLQILSCFGSQVDQDVLKFLADYDGESSVDITAAIGVALNEGLIEQAAHLVSFSHDIIQKATLDSISEDAVIPLLRKLSSALVKNASAVNDLNSILFVVVDLINRIGSDATNSPDERALFADLNARAGSKSILVPDFASAAKYAENGITFLSDGHWEIQYDLSLQLYETAALSHFSSPESNRDQLMARINAVFDHAKDFSDKFKTHCVWIKLVASKNLSRATEESLDALEQLGEPLHLANIDLKTVRDELAKHRDQFSGERKKKFLATRRMADCNKVRAMKVMSSLTVYYQQQFSFHAAFISCRMIRMSIDDGHCEGSVFGAACFAANLINNLEDIDEGSSWARVALSLMEMYNKNILLPYINALLYGRVLVWKEPIQSTMEPLAQGIRSSFTTGNVECANLNTAYYVARSFNCGQNIGVLTCEVNALARQHGVYFGYDNTSGSPINSPLLEFYLTALFNTLSDLDADKGPIEGVEDPFHMNKVRVMKNDDILKITFEKRQIACHQIILSYQTFKALLFRELDSALKYSDMFFNNPQVKAQTMKDLKMKISSLYIIFYGALIAFYFARQTGEERHQLRGECAILKMKEWSKHSDWNFKNKLLLMEAESLNTQNDLHKATLCYESSIKAAQEHKFIHEEAIASELAGIFFFERGLHLKSYRFFRQSILCYEKWGAHAVARRVRHSIQNKFDSDLMQICKTVAPMVPVVTLSSEELSSKKRQPIV